MQIPQNLANPTAILNQSLINLLRKQMTKPKGEETKVPNSMKRTRTEPGFYVRAQPIRLNHKRLTQIYR